MRYICFGSINSKLIKCQRRHKLYLSQQQLLLPHWIFFNLELINLKQIGHSHRVLIRLWFLRTKVRIWIPWIILQNLARSWYDSWIFQPVILSVGQRFRFPDLPWAQILEVPALWLSGYLACVRWAGLSIVGNFRPEFAGINWFMRWITVDICSSVRSAALSSSWFFPWSTRAKFGYSGLRCVLGRAVRRYW